MRICSRYDEDLLVVEVILDASNMTSKYVLYRGSF
jgi:hypothetical protein